VLACKFPGLKAQRIPSKVCVLLLEPSSHFHYAYQICITVV